MLNAEPNTTSDILSENGSHHTSIVAVVPSSHHPSPHRPEAARSVKVRLRLCVAEGSGPLGNDARSHPPIFFPARPDAEFC
jgi:hypothetical protein